MNKEQVLVFRGKVMHYTFNSICVFGLTCIGMCISAAYFGALPLVFLTFASFIYQVFFSFYFERKMIKGEISKDLAKLVLYLNAFSFAPSTCLILLHLNHADVCIALGITSLLCALSYYISENIPVTKDQLTVIRYLVGYVASSLIASLIGGILMFFGFNIFPYIRILFPQILLSAIFIAMGVYFINYWLQVSNHLAERVYSAEELELKSIFISVQISSWIMIIFRQILQVMLNNKRRR